MEIKQLFSSDITDEYLATLNDAGYMQFSRNSTERHTIESQTIYIESFDKSTLNAKSIILGIFDRNRLIGTSTVYFDRDSLCANIGMLIFKSYASKGFAKKSLTWISAWVAARLPAYSIQVGMSKSNIAMIRTALSCGFSKIDSVNTEIHLFEYSQPSGKLIFPQEMLQNESTLFFASDTGGAEALLEFFLLKSARKRLLVCGQGQDVFRYFGIPYSGGQEINYTEFKSLFFSTGSACSYLAKIQRCFESLGLTQTCILDHWVNYKERFIANGINLPNSFLVTNEIAHEKAISAFPNSRIVLTPDLRLERLKSLISVNFPRDQKHVLALLEPERPRMEGLGKISIEVQLGTIRQAKLIANQLGLDSVVLRLHPKMSKSKWLEEILQNDDSLKLSRYERLEDDLSNTEAVVGLSSSVLYSTSKLGIPTFTVLESTENSWLGMCKEIQKF